MPRVEKLPKGFWRSPSGSLRVQVRATGHAMASKSFPLFADTPLERRRQREDAEAWAVETRRRMHGGTHVSNREAEVLTLAEALARYERDKLDVDNANHRKDVNRIRAILADPMSARTVASMRATDMAAYRDRLVHGGWLASVEAARRRAQKGEASKARLDDIGRLVRLRSEADAEHDPRLRRALVKEREAIEAREGVRPPARTTISNKVQLITRALGYLSESVDGVPDLTGTQMPSATPGRERRLREGELERLLSAAPRHGGFLSPAVRLAVGTTLRRERLLELAPRHIVDIGGGRSVIMFPRDAERRRKRTGIVPVTAEIRRAIEDAAGVAGRLASRDGDPGRPFLDVNGNTFDHQWRDLVLSCGIDDLHFHDLRHEGTSRLFERGLNTAEVMSITGHSTQEMVDRYSHYSASIVHDKLVNGPDLHQIGREIAVLARQFLSIGGDAAELRRSLGL